MSERSPLASYREAICDSELDPASRHVALVLAMYMKASDRTCFPSKLTLARRTGYSKRTVDRAIRQLEETGYLDVRHSRGNRKNHYQGVIPDGAARTPSTVQELHGKGASDDTRPCSSDTPTVQMTAPDGAGAAPESLLTRSESLSNAESTTTGKAGNHRTNKSINYASYTGCEYVRGSHASSYVRNPLGKDKPPPDWKYPPPGPREIDDELAMEEIEREIEAERRALARPDPRYGPGELEPLFAQPTSSEVLNDDDDDDDIDWPAA
jgi:hypothetical protein